MEFDFSLPEGWKWVKLADLADPKGRAIVSGPFGSNIGSKFFVDSGVPVIRGNNLTTGAKKFLDEGFVFVTPEKARELGNVDAIPGDLIFTAAGSLGQVGIIPEETRYPLYIISNKQMRVRVNRDLVNTLYAYLWFSSKPMVDYIQRQNTGSSVPLINLSIIRQLPIPLPPMPEQQAIAAVLGTLDDKIELNRRMNVTLENMARALFQSWFVDFDPVRAKMDGRQPVGMDKATADLFPARFQESAFGRIPYGWRACTLGDIARNVSITFDFTKTPEVVFINTGDVLEGDFLHSTRGSHAGLPGQAKKSIQPDDILFSEIRPANKRYAYVDFDSHDYVVSTKFMIIRGEGEIHPRLLYRILTADETLNEFQVQAESRSGTFPQITFDSISYLPIVLPSKNVQDAFQQCVTAFDARVKGSKQQSRILAALRDTLLPKLLSGELRIKDAERFFSEAV